MKTQIGLAVQAAEHERSIDCALDRRHELPGEVTQRLSGRVPIEERLTPILFFEDVSQDVDVILGQFQDVDIALGRFQIVSHGNSRK
jgi:hypothetical protein